MEHNNLETPVVLFVYNRPKTTKRVIEKIAKNNPPELYVVADGPNRKNQNEIENCKTTRQVVENTYQGMVFRNYSSKNMGIKKRISTGLNWVFDQVDQAIILEDDTVPNSQFFRFCEDMLQRYEGDNRIFDITGTNELGTWKSANQDYHFSVYGSVWGWATWADSWDNYEVEMTKFKDQKAKDALRFHLNDYLQYYWRNNLYERTYKNQIDTWDFQWTFAKQINSGLSIVPSKNLVSNIGFGDHATHTKRNDGRAKLRKRQLNFPLQKNPYVVPDRDFDDEIFNLRSSGKGKMLLKLFLELTKKAFNL